MNIQPLTEATVVAIRQNKTALREYLDSRYLLLASECATASTDEDRILNSIKLSAIDEVRADIEGIIEPQIAMQETSGYNQ